MGNFAGFQSVQMTAPQKSEFDLSHRVRTSTRMGRLTPIVTLECIPGDVFKGSSEILTRLAPLLAPIYDNIEMYVHYFFVPNRLLWTEWEEFITGGRLGVGVDPVEAPLPPYADIGLAIDADDQNFATSSLSDYLGVPILLDIEPNELLWSGKKIDLMPYIAYQLIYQEHYRDRNFEPDDLVVIPCESGLCDAAQADAYMKLQTRSYIHDYFTSALPFTQRGTEVLMPLAGTGSVTYLTNALLKDNSGAALNVTSYIGTQPGIGGVAQAYTPPGPSAATTNVGIHNIASVDIDASSVSVNDTRTAIALQVWLEKNAVGGSRYNENTLIHFGVKPQDMRLQRPEYIGGGRIDVKISEIVSTYSDKAQGADPPQGNMTGHGITYGNTNRFNYFCVEHGFIMGIASFMNRPAYHQGMPRMFYKRRTFLDYVWPTFAKLGEQPVDKAELYAEPINLEPDVDGEYALFGYQSRYADWKYICSTNRGDFHDSLLFWTLTRDFSDTPVLGDTFVHFDDASQNRIFAVGGTGDNFWLYISHVITVYRALPYFGAPNNFGFQ